MRPYYIAGGRGGGGNRGGAFNLFTAGGFFGNGGGQFSLFERLRMMVLFFAWSACMYAVTASVFQLAKQAVSGITIPKWDTPAKVDSAAVGYGETALMTEETEEESDGMGREGNLATTIGAGTFLFPVEAVASRSGSVTRTESPSQDQGGAEGSGAGLEELGIEAGTVDERQRAYLDLLDRHSSASKSGNGPKATELGIGSHIANSGAIYLAMMGCVAFFFVVS